MLHEGGQQSVMVLHDAETLAERGFVMASGHTLAQIVCHDGMRIDQRKALALSLTHDAYAPIEVGREAITEVVMEEACQVGTSEKGLMAYEHTIAERAPIEVLGWGETTGAQEASIAIYEMGVAIDHGGQD